MATYKYLKTFRNGCLLCLLKAQLVAQAEERFSVRLPSSVLRLANYRALTPEELRPCFRYWLLLWPDIGRY